MDIYEVSSPLNIQEFWLPENTTSAYVADLIIIGFPSEPLFKL